MTAQTSAGLDAENPWPSLGAFGEADKDYFNGRDRETTDLLRLVNAAPFTLLFGASGHGKTSLLRAGLAHRLWDQNKLPVYVRLDPDDRERPIIEQVFNSFLEELKKQDVDHPPAEPGESLWEYLHRSELELWSKENYLVTPVFIFDQFEEMFTIGAANADAVNALREDLADLIENLVPASVAERYEHAPLDGIDLRARRSKVLISFREDYLPDTEDWRGVIPSLSTPNRLRLIQMNGHQALQAVRDTGGGLVDSATAEGIVRLVAAERAKLRGRDRAGEAAPNSEASDLSQVKIEPALLSLICTKLNERRKDERKATIDQDLLSKAAPDIVKDFYEESMRDLPLSARRFIEEELITEGGYRNTYDRDEAIAQNYLSTEQIEKLVKGRLLRSERHPSGPSHLKSRV
jgi:hypothetical protein